MPAQCTKCGEEHPDWVPASRVSTVTAQRRAAKEEAEALAAQVEALNEKVKASETAQATIDALTSQLGEWQSKEAAWSTEKAVMGAGIYDAEGVGVVSLLYGQVPADARPSGGIAEWLSNRDALPRAVRAYLPQPATDAAPAAPASPDAAAQPAAPRPPADPNRGARLATDAPAAFPQGSVSSMTTEQYRAQRGAVWETLGRPAPPPPPGTLKSTD